MDTTTAPASRLRRRQLVADLVDVALLGALTAVGFGITHAVVAAGSTDPWAGLGALLAGLAVAAVVGFLAWVAVLVRLARGRPTPGTRLAGADAGRVLPTAGRHVAVVVVLYLVAAVVAAAPEPPPAGPVTAAVAGGLAALLVASAWWDAPRTRRAQAAAVAATVALVVVGAVPDRAPYAWELRADTEAALLAHLEADPAARRACEDLAGPEGPRASHATAPCSDVDQQWLVAARRDAVAAELRATAIEAVGTAGDVTEVRGNGTVEVHVDGLPVAIVRHRQDCATEVFLGRAVVRPTADAGHVHCG